MTEKILWKIFWKAWRLFPTWINCKTISFFNEFFKGLAKKTKVVKSEYRTLSEINIKKNKLLTLSQFFHFIIEYFFEFLLIII